MDFLLFTSDKLLAKNYLIFHASSRLILARHTTLDTDFTFFRGQAVLNALLHSFAHILQASCALSHH